VVDAMLLAVLVEKSGIEPFRPIVKLTPRGLGR